MNPRLPRETAGADDGSLRRLLRESKARFRDVFDHINDLVFIVEPGSGRILDANRRACECLGYLREELCATMVPALGPPEEADRVRENLRRVSEDGAVTFERHLRRRDGTLLPCEVSARRTTLDGREVIVSVARDIGERRRAEEALRTHEQLLNLFVEHSPAAIAMFDRDMRYLAASRRWKTDYGLGDRDILGRSHYEIFPEIPERWKEVHRRGLAGATERCEEDPFARADGRTDWVRWEVRPWRRADDEIGGIIIFSEVITARKQAEVALRESEERLRLALAGADLGTWHWNLHTDELVWSDRCLTMFGLPPGTPMNYEKFLGTLHLDDRARADEAVRRALRERTEYRIEFRTVWPDGSVHWAASRGRAYYDDAGRPARMEGVALDITERKRAEELLRESERKLRLVIDGLGPSLFVGLTTPDGILLEANKPALDAAGLTAQDVVGKPVEETYWFTHDASIQQQLRAAIRRAARGEASRYDVQVRVADGAMIWIDLSVEPLRDAAGKVIYLVPSASVITERKQALLQLEKNTERLEQLSRQLLAAQETERRRIARELHDELGQALTAIKINLQARDRLRGQSPAELDAVNIGLVENALQQVRQLALALRPSMLDDLGLVPALRWMAGQQAERGDIAVRFDFDVPAARLTPEIETACFRIAQEALTNIARHARARHATVGLRREADTLLLTVEDDGRGFDVDAMRTHAAAGGSIGVIGMQERAALLDGELTIESQPGRGTTVRARLPWRAAGEAG